MINKHIFSIFLLVCTLFVQAQQSVQGTITSNKLPIEAATVAIPDAHLETISAQNGTYFFSSVPKGKHKLIVSCLGYQTQIIDITIPIAQQSVNINLEESVHQMDEVIISTAFNKIQSQNVMKVEHQSLKSMQQKGVTSLAEGLATIPGVSQISTGTSIGKPVIRGLSGNRVLVYNQGVRLENQQFGEEHGLGLNDTGIESVEVIKGPASLLYGSDALGGVLYFNPEKFARVNSQQFNYQYKYFTNTQGTSQTLGYKLSGESLKFSTIIAQNNHADYTIPNKNRIVNTRFKELDFKTALGYISKYFNTIFSYNFNKIDLGIPEKDLEIPEGESSNNKNPLYPKQKVLGQIASWNSVFFFKYSKLETDLGYIDNHRNEFENSEIPILNMKLKTFNYTAKYYLPKGKYLESIVGVQGMYQKNSNYGEELLIPNASTQDFGVFATANYEKNKHTFQAGLRYDYRNINTITHGIANEEGYFAGIDKKFKSINGSLGYKTEWKKNTIVRLNVASGFRAPNLAELTSNGIHEGSNRYEKGNNDLKNEQNLQTDINVEYRNPHFELFVNGFYNRINNYIYIAPTAEELDGYLVYQYEQNNAYLFGGEAGVHFHPHPLDWLHIITTFECVTGKRTSGENLPLIPANKWNMNVKIDLKEYKNLSNSYFTINTDYFFKQNKISLFETPTQDYVLVNLGLGTKITLGKSVFDVYCNANNIFNKNYIAHLSRLKIDGIPNMGRNFMFGVNFTW